MAPTQRTKMLAELLDDYVEERVRQFPTEAFDLAKVKRSISETLRDADAGLLASADDLIIAQRLNEHPFLVAASGGSKLSWKPGLAKGLGKLSKKR